ncbi:MAG: primosomal protein N' [Pseudomonadota bacterium]
MEPTTIQVAVPRPLHAVYDYKVPADIDPPRVGARVRVPFGRSRTVGVCVARHVANPHPKLKAIDAVLDADAAIPGELLELARWMSSYYHHPLGEVLATMLPAAARKGAEFKLDPPPAWIVSERPFANGRAKEQARLHAYLAEHGPVADKKIVELGFSRAVLRNLAASGSIRRAQFEPSASEAALTPTAAQSAAIEAVVAGLGHYRPILLEGVTGSGKTEVYLQAIAASLASAGQVLVLVPEIALTPQTLARFQRRFDRVGMLHSNLSDHERLQTWLRARNGELDVVIGTRSAIFTAFQKLSLIIVDEEHDSSYKQQDGLRYSARDLALKRGQDHQVPVVLGSATPSFETLHNAAQARFAHLKLLERAGGASMPSYHLIDMRGQSLQDGVSVPLQHVIRKHLSARGQILLFLNRRGFAPTLLCAACGWQAECSDCDARLTLHQQPAGLTCHHCGLKFQVPATCEACGKPALMPVGVGTQRTEEALEKLFADIPIIRIDRDTTRTNNQLEAHLAKINQGAPCLMIGTQMLAKGHHFPNVTMVGIINADAGFASPDFRAPERTAQLIVQVAGRAGRAERAGEVWIQTYQPESAALVALIEQGYTGFAAHELGQRRAMDLPPERPMAMIRADAVQPELSHQWLTALLEAARRDASLQPTETLGPAPAPLARLAKRHRYQIMLIAPDRRALHRALRHISGLARANPPPGDTRWSIDVDPYDTL